MTSPALEGLNFSLEDLMTDCIDENDDNLIFSYIRKQAIEDGVFIEIPKLEDQPNIFKYQTVVTTAVYSILDITNIQADFQALLKTIAWAIIEQNRESDRVDFFFKEEGMYALCHPDDDGCTPVITIMLTNEN
jgi:hypothetical protein